MKAFILFNVNIGTIPEVVHNLRRLPAVQSAEMTFGEYDIVAVVETENINALARMVAQEIHPMPGVQRTHTCMAVDIDG